MRSLLLAPSVPLLAAVPVSLATPALADAAIRPSPGIVLSGPDVSGEIQLADGANPVWLKIQAEWERIEPTPGEYDVEGTAASRAMERLGAWLAEAKATGARTQLIVYNAPAWASGRPGAANDPPTPENVPRYAALMRTIAERYGAHIDAYVPWNEPNLDIFWNPPDPVAYVNLQRAVYEAVGQVDPTALVASAPIAGSRNSYAYITRAYRAGLSRWIDALGWNAYPPTTPEARLFQRNGLPATSTLGAQAQVERILARFDPRREVWMGEFGWSTCVGCPPPNRVSDSVQARYLPRAFLYLRRYASRVTVATWFKLLDGSPNRALWHQNSGLRRFDRSAKPSYNALRNLERRIRVPRPAMRLSLKAIRRDARGTTAITRPRIAYDWGRISLRTRISVPGQGMYVLQGYKNGRWSRIASGRISAGSNPNLAFDDSGELAVRLLVRASGDSGWSVGRVVRLKGTLPPAG